MILFDLYLAACILLAAAGALKAARPHDTARALVASAPWWPGRHGHALVRVGAALEAALGLVAVAWPTRTAAAAVAASYLGFCLFVLLARAKGGPLASCGCFGTPDTPPTAVHVVVDACLCAAAVAVAVAAPAGSIGSVLYGQYDHGWPIAAAGGLIAWLVYLVLSPLARLGALRTMTPHATGRARS
jgi:hypothetical protein